MNSKSSALNRKGQASLEVIASVAVMILLFSSVLFLSNQRNAIAEDENEAWEMQNLCRRVSSSISQAYFSGNGFKWESSWQEDYNVTVHQFNSVSVSSQDENSEVICNYTGKVDESTSFTNSASFENLEGVVVINA